MKQFKDAEGREWRLTVNVGTAKAVRDLAHVNLFQVHNEEAARLFGDPILLIDVLYVLCRDQCHERHMSDQDFGRSMTGDSIEDGANALLEEVALFFPSGRRNLLQKQMSKARELTDRIMAQASERLDTLDLSTLSNSPTKQRASSD